MEDIGPAATDHWQETADNQPIVSVIVPNYNAAQFLPTCLDSLRAQTLENIEIICVDDGSTDDSLDILKQYAQLDSRIKVIAQANQGQSAARNTALENAKAPYIMNCDSDDWFDLDMCRLMVETLEREQVDMVICATNVIMQVPEDLQDGMKEYLRLKHSGKQLIDQGIMLSTNVFVWNKIFKRSIINEHQISYPIGLLYEDAYFCDAYLVVSDSIYYLDVALYNYLRHETSVMSLTYQKATHTTDHLLIVMKTWENLEKEGLLESHCEFFWRRFFEYLILTLRFTQGTEHRNAKTLAKTFVRQNQKSLAQASIKTRAKINLFIYGNFKMLSAVHGFFKNLR